MKRTILLFVFFLSTFVSAQNNKLELRDIFTNAEFYGKSLKNVHWFDDGNKISYTINDPEEGNSIFQFDINKQKESLLISGKQLKEKLQDDDFTIKNYLWSPEENYILFTSTIPARSLKTGGNFYLYDVHSKQFILKVESDEKQMNIKFSPDESKIGFVRSNNLFVVDVKTGKEQQLTFDGSETILNGVFDWAYEEEFSIIEGWNWSPDSKAIAFWQSDQSNVPIFPIVHYDSIYNSVEYQHYPKVGANIAEVKIGVANIDDGKINWMNTGNDKNIYLPRMMFTNNPSVIAIQKLNRLQNKLELLFANINTGNTKLILTEEDEHWVDVWDHLTFLKNSEKFIWSSERDGFLHLYLIDYEGNVINQITKGNFEIDDLVTVDEKNKTIYYTSNELSPLYKNLYSIKFDGSGKKLITEATGTHSIDMPQSGKYFIDKYSNSHQITSTYLYSTNGELIHKFFEPDMSFIQEYGFTPVEFQSFTTSDGVELNSFLIKPHDFDKNKKYPVIIYNYSGPGSKTVTDKWMSYYYLLHQYFAQNGFLVFAVDNRGTGGRGREFEHTVYKNLGKWELNDIIEGINWLNKSGFIDTSRIAIYGTSYGGYMAALALLKAPEYFKAGIAAAGLSHWKYYDAIYTERFMQDEQLNPAGYFESAPVNYAGNLSGKLLIIHGTADDNVHFHNSVELVEELITKNKQFDLMIYPGKKHGGFGLHYYYLIADYILKNL